MTQFPDIGYKCHSCVGRGAYPELSYKPQARLLKGYPGITYSPSTPEVTRPIFIVDSEGKIARVIKWDAEGNPTVVYPGKSGGLTVGTPTEGGQLPRQYKLSAGWQPTKPTDFTKAIKPSGSAEMIELRMWQDEFSKVLQVEKRPYPMSGQERRREILEARIKRGEPVPEKLLAEFPDLKAIPKAEAVPKAVTPEVAIEKPLAGIESPLVGHWENVENTSTIANAKWRAWEGNHWADYDASGGRLATGKDWATTPTSKELATWDAEIAIVVERGNKAGILLPKDRMFVRFGDIPKIERSRNLATGELESGVSAFEVSYNPSTDTLQYVEDDIVSSAIVTGFAEKRKIILLTGKVVGRGGDGEHLLRKVTVVSELSSTPYGFELPKARAFREAIERAKGK